MSKILTMDDVPLNKFHKRVAVFTSGGFFCDGYILGLTGIALALLVPDLNVNPFWEGMIASSALIGLFIGGLIFGWVTDRIGRQVAFVIDLAAFIVVSILQFFVTDAIQLFILRLIMGIAIGADYAIAPALLSEFSPRRVRGMFLAWLNASWTIGFVVAVFVSFLMQHYGGADAWRWILASSAVPALIVLGLRLGAPESPRWLVKQGRVEEAKRIIHDYLGPNVAIDDLFVEKDTKTHYRELFTKKWRKRIAVGGGFWFCQVTPYFAILTFGPLVLSQVGIQNEFAGTLAMNLVLLIGAMVGLWIVDRVPRNNS
ncbi:sugar transport protein [Melghirimyces profundicolus]|uniref:Sugar transport protein n=1 Tax=Melghirimyces profundicolus TaxID=1242148 RepID=A0A2T6C8Y4_9BACL|nr:MFS transporter [Melghirimyces profundicolus]PTX64788.1 sugar transport protein [Melghirimyces profundicolus]